MKKVMLIGEFNEITKHISESLSPYCRVQLCAVNTAIAEGMLRMFAPDLTIVSLLGTRDSHEALFSTLAQTTPDVPVIAVGSQANEQELTKAGLLPDERIRFLHQPIHIEDIIAWTREILNITMDDAAPDGMKKILVVDDSPAMLRTVQGMLSGRYRVTFATSGTRAIAAIAKSRPDLILLDYDMPVCDGEMTLQMLRSEEDTRDIPVVFLTGCSDAEHVKKVLALHPQGYLLKPPVVNKLCLTIERVLAAAEGTAT